MDRVVVPAHIFAIPKVAPGIGSAEIKTEVIRKAIHFLIALSPSMAAINHSLTIVFLAFGILFYISMECFRLSGVQVPLISKLTRMASRARDDGKLVFGPVTLGVGALLALLFYPSPASAIAIYALAFGDGLASLAGKLYGSIRPAFMMGKSVEGSTACFAAVLLSAFLVSRNIPTALVAALVATVVEALPLEDYDNLALPVAVGLVVQFRPL
jgi:dolichol kinase